MADQEKQAAPYTSFQSLKGLIKQFKDNGVPSRIDRSVMNRFSGAVGGQLMTALKFLNLIGDDNAPYPAFHALCKTYDTGEWASHLEELLRQAYAPVFTIDLQNASPAQFNEVFRKSYQAADAVQRKSIAFFLSAVRETTIPVSQYIMQKTRQRTAGVRKKQTSKAKPTPIPQTPNHVPTPPAYAVVRTPSETLLSLFDPADMGHDEQAAVWTLMKYFKGKGQ